MKKMSFTLSLLLILVLASCHRRPLLDPEDSALLKVRLVTDGINNVTTNIYNEQVERPVITSDMMRVFVYDEDGSSLLSQGFLKSKSTDTKGYEVLSGPIKFSAGNYRLLSYNFDMGDTFIADEDGYHTVYAYTNEIPQALYSRFGSRAEGLGPVYYEPEHVMVARKPDLGINPSLSLRTIEMDAHTVVKSYYIQIRISGQENMAAKASGLAVLSGLSQCSLLGEGVPEGDPISIYFEMQRSTDPRIEDENQQVLCAVFNTFGRIEEVPSNLKVTLTVLARNGETHQKEIDMTSVFQTEDARLRHWLLIDEVWDIPDISGGEEGGGGFGPAVTDWEDIEETIPIGPNT